MVSIRDTPLLKHLIVEITLTCLTKSLPMDLLCVAVNISLEAVCQIIGRQPSAVCCPGSTALLKLNSTA